MNVFAEKSNVFMKNAQNAPAHNYEHYSCNWRIFFRDECPVADTEYSISWITRLLTILTIEISPYTFYDSKLLFR